MRKSYFITATNTDVGKTIFTATLTHWLRSCGIDAIPVKPVQSGQEGEQLAVDLKTISELTDLKFPEEELKLLAPYCYQDACSPHLASERDDLPPPSIEHIKSTIKILQSKHELLLVEGAGGALVPIDRARKLRIIDIIKELELETIVVALSGLGTINSTCLTIDALKNRGIVVAGFILNDTKINSGPEYITKDNIRTIEEFSGAPCLGLMPHMKDITPQAMNVAMDAMPKLKRLFDAEAK